MGKPYRVCPRCGASLDAGEKCDCGDQAETEPSRENTEHREPLPGIENQSLSE